MHVIKLHSFLVCFCFVEFITLCSHWTLQLILVLLLLKADAPQQRLMVGGGRRHWRRGLWLKSAYQVAAYPVVIIITDNCNKRRKWGRRRRSIIERWLRIPLPPRSCNKKKMNKNPMVLICTRSELVTDTKLRKRYLYADVKNSLGST